MSIRSEIVEFIRDQLRDNDNGVAVIGMSGGKDSTITAALCVEALGSDRVVGIMMPNGSQIDLADSVAICQALGIEHHYINIGNAYNALSMEVANAICRKDEQPLGTVWNNDMFTTNTPARLRMTTLYAVAAFYPGSRVVNTCNRSEDYVGYSTKYGDAAGDFSPIGDLTVRELLVVGQEYVDEGVLKPEWVYKIPEDGMSGKSDEEKLGFTYEEEDDYLLNGKDCKTSWDTIKKIERLHKATRHKYCPMPMFKKGE